MMLGRRTVGMEVLVCLCGELCLCGEREGVDGP